MEKYIIDKDEFQLYYLMLQSEEPGIIKEGVQKFSDSFAKGRYLLNSDIKNFCISLEHLLSNSKYAQIHKWVYKCTCFYCTPKIEEICIKNFFCTSDSETRNWIISTIASRYYDYDEFKTVIDSMKQKAVTNGQFESLDIKNIYYSASIFGHFKIQFDTESLSSKIFREDDKNGMYWMAKLFAYSELASKKNLDSLIKCEELDMLTCSDDEQIQTYAYWGLVHRTGGSLNLTQEEHKHQAIAKDSLKWYYAGIIPGEYISRNFDFIEQVLKSTNEKFRNSIRVKEGILIGLNTIPYESRFDGFIIEWYYKENFNKIKIKLLEYLIKNVNKNREAEQKFDGYGSFFSVIQDECCNMEVLSYIINYIHVYKTLTIRKEGNEIILCTKEEIKMNEHSINGGNFYGPVFMNNSGVINYENKNEIKLFSETLDKFINTCDDQKLVTESKELQKNLQEGSSDLKGKLFAFGSHLANYITIASAAPKAVQLAKNLIEYIQTIF